MHFDIELTEENVETKILAQLLQELNTPRQVVPARAPTEILNQMKMAFGKVLIAVTPIDLSISFRAFLGSARLTPQAFHTLYWSKSSLPTLEQKVGLYVFPSFFPLQYRDR
jgi:hypothetical protein